MGSWYTEEEYNVIKKVLDESKDWNNGFYAGEIRKEFENKFSEYLGVKHSLCINSGGTGMDLAMKYLDIKRGDEVISCAINFPGTHLSIIGAGAKLILCEPDNKTLNLDYKDLQNKLTKKTKAIVVTHMNGLSADMDKILECIRSYNKLENTKIKVICDAARACGARDNDSYVGCKGLLTIFSFQTKKLMTTLGEGGMISTNNDHVLKKIYRMRAFGDGIDWGSNFHMTKVQAAVGIVQLRRLNEMNSCRITIANFRNEILNRNEKYVIPIQYENYKHVYYLYTIILNENYTSLQRDKLKKILEDKFRIGTVIGNKPTFYSNKLIRTSTKGQHLPTSESIGNRIICLPLHPLMTKDVNCYISESFLKSFKYL